MSAKVAFLSQELPEELRTRRTVILPKAIVESDGKGFVYRVESDRAVATPIETGAKLGDAIEVLKGVEPGAKVVANPSPKLHDGARITVQSQKE
jgi:hypothetical protein